MSDDDDKRPPSSGPEPEAEASEAEASSDAVLTADPEDREIVRRPSRPTRGVTRGRLGVMVLAVASLPVFWWVIVHSTGEQGQSMPVEEDPVVRLSKDVAGLRADIQLFEERLDRVEDLGVRLDSLSQRLDEQRNTEADQQSRRASFEARLERLQSQAESQLSSLAKRLSSPFDDEAAVPETERESHNAIQLEVLHLEPMEVGDEG